MAKPRGGTLSRLFEVSEQERQAFFERIQQRVQPGAGPERPGGGDTIPKVDTLPTVGPVPMVGTGPSVAAVPTIPTVATVPSQPTAPTVAPVPRDEPPVPLTPGTVPYIPPVLTMGTAQAARLVRANTVQDGHTIWEQAIYDALWRQATPVAADYRELAIGYRHIAALTGLGLKTIQRNMKGLAHKLTLEPVGRYDPDTRTPKTYRIYSFRAILDRRRAAGLEWVLINRQGVTLTTAPTVTAVPTVAGVPTEPPLPTVASVPTLAPESVPTVAPPDSPHGGRSFRAGAQEPSATSSSALRTPVGELLRRYLPADDDAVARLVEGCLRADPTATAEEIVHFAGLKLAQHRHMRGIQNPIGLLIESVPKCFAGDLIREYRDELGRRAGQGRDEARKILDDPQASDADRVLARRILSEES